MGRERDSWVELVRAVWTAALDVLKAEAEVLGQEWQRFARHLAAALACFALVVIASLYVVELLVQGAVEGVRATWPTLGWTAPLVVAGAIFVVMLVVGGIGALVLRRVDPPTRSARRRFDDHVTWWRTTVLDPPPAVTETGESENHG